MAHLSDPKSGTTRLPTGDLPTPLHPRDLDRGEGPDTKPKLSCDDDTAARRGYIRIIQRLQKQHDRCGAQFYGDSRKYRLLEIAASSAN